MLRGTQRRLSAVPIMGVPPDTSRAVGTGKPAAEPSFTQKTKPVYRFEDIEVNCSQGVLKRGGQEQYVRQQSFHVLLYVLEHRHRLVSKEELIEHFWQHTAVTDNALVQCIADIRKVLGDDSRHPRFVKTVPKVGYRFIGCVEEECTPDDVEEIGASREWTYSNTPSTFGEDPRAPRVSRFRASPRQTILLLAIVTVLSILSFVALRYWYATRVELTLPQIPGRKSVAVMYFEDQSGRSDLSWLREGLADMFITNLSHSGKLTVLSRQQLQVLVQRTHHMASAIRLDDALDIARRSHAEAVIVGSFAGWGEGLVVNIRLYETSHGQLLASDRLTVNRLADILTQVDLVSLNIASHLGVAPRENGKKTSLAEVMTKSFEAYRYYSLGVDKAQMFENAEP